MKRNIVLLFWVLFICIRGIAQPSETYYLGNVIADGYTNNIQFDSDGPFPIGFNFNFFGNSYTEFYASANGLITFTDPTSIYSTEVSIPDAAVPNNYIAPFWDDLVVDGSGKISYKTIGASPNRKLIVQFNNMGFYPFPVFMGTFSVILYETSNKIQIQYRLIVDNSSSKAHGESATIGIENQDGSAGVLYEYHNASAVTSEQAITFTPSGSTYVIDSNAIYDGVYLISNVSLPEPGITTLIAPPQDAIIGEDFTFQWGTSSNATNYSLKISNYPDLTDAVSYDAGTNLSYNITGLILDTTYYWGVFASNNTGLTWCEINRFTTSSVPPLVAVPQTIWTEQSQDKTIKLYYSGGNASPKTAIITSLPSQGELYQYNSGSRGSLISTVPTDITDSNMNLIYVASGSSGNGVGSFGFKMNDDSGDSPDATITVNVSPPGVPNVLYLARNSDVEIQFDIPMADPFGKHDQFTVNVNGSPATIASAELKEGDTNTILLTLAAPLDSTDAVIVSYTQGDVAGASGGYLFSFTDEPDTLMAQTIDFPQTLTKKYNESPIALNAISSSGLSLGYSSSDLSVATTLNNLLTFHSLGTSDITAIQNGDSVYAPARYVKTLTVSIGDQAITFNSIPEKGSSDPDFDPGAIASSGLAVSYASSNTSVATIVNGKIHIVGVGSTDITASQSGSSLYNPAVDVVRTLVVTSSDKTLNLSSVMLEGLYNGSGTMRQAWNALGPQWPAGVADHITVELHSSSDYSTIIYSVSDVELSTTGTASVTIPGTYNGSYYITVKHRNSIETTTASPVSFAGSTINQSFVDPANVYGNNLGTSFDGYYLIYGGDANQDGSVDTGDYTPVVNAVSSYLTGYLATDINGNGSVDTGDYSILVNNVSNYIRTYHP